MRFLFGLHLSLALLTAAAAAQIPIRYGEPATSGSITAALQSHRYLLMDARAGDTLRITFASQNSGYPSYYYYHQLQVWDGANAVGSPIVGYGIATITVPRTAIYTIEVRARDGQSTGWYAFKTNRLNDPVGAHRVAFNWHIRGAPASQVQIPSRTEFDVYTLHADAGANAVLRFTCQDSGYPSYYYYHYVEIVDAAGTRIADVVGNGGPAQFTFPTAGIYTLVVGARDHQSTGWYAVSVECPSWPAAPCDSVPHASNYGAGWPGTNGVPALTASALARLGQTAVLDVGNSWGQPTTGFLLLGLDYEKRVLSAFDGTLHVLQPTILPPFPIPMGGTRQSFPIPDDPILTGLGFALQALVVDPGASQGLAFSRGMLLIPG